MFDNFHEQKKYWQVPDDVALEYVPSTAWKAVALCSNGLDTSSLGLHGFDMTCVDHVTNLRFFQAVHGWLCNGLGTWSNPTHAKCLKTCRLPRHSTCCRHVARAGDTSAHVRHPPAPVRTAIHCTTGGQTLGCP